MSKVIYIDVETTGLDCNMHGIRELAFIVEIDGFVVDKGLLKINPFTYTKEIKADAKALEISGKTLDEIISSEYEKSFCQFLDFTRMLDKYVDSSNKEDKFTINGYNTSFDIAFLKAWFNDNGMNKFFSSYFSYKELDVFALVKQFKHLGLIDTKNDKLKTVCEYFNIPLDAHNALDDIVATKELSEKLISMFVIKNIKQDRLACKECKYCDKL